MTRHDHLIEKKKRNCWGLDVSRQHCFAPQFDLLPYTIQCVTILAWKKYHCLIPHGLKRANCLHPTKEVCIQQQHQCSVSLLQIVAAEWMTDNDSLYYYFSPFFFRVPSPPKTRTVQVCWSNHCALLFSSILLLLLSGILFNSFLCALLHVGKSSTTTTATPRV